MARILMRWIMITGRTQEKQRLNNIFSSKESEFLVVYGRRRVGKTYLIREFFQQKKCVFFHATGSYKEKLSIQLERFVETLSKTFLDNVPLKITSWEEAFRLLHQQILKYSSQKKIVLFLDELPWLATKRSGLLSLLEYYWNHYWSAQKNVLLIVCGSSASWLIKNIVYNKGGLHNRITSEIHLKPFTLNETKEYLYSRKVKLTLRQILLLYMALGGIPYYLRYVEPHLTADQNIQHILFDDNAPLRDEFKKLFLSLFEHAEAYLEIIYIVSKSKIGIKRTEIENQTKLSSNGGRLTARLRDLCLAGFLEQKPALNRKTGEYYQLIDEFTLFQMYWVIPESNQRFSPNHWLMMTQDQRYKIWSGYTFEAICFKHSAAIVKALDIVSWRSIAAWRFTSKQSSEENGAQIDLIIDRQDDAMSLCEIKFTQEPFTVDKIYAKKLQEKMSIFEQQTKTKKQLFWVLISASGVKPSMYSEEFFQKILSLEDLYAP